MNNIISADLNLLKVFAVLSEDANVSRASKLLGVSQPATSHALSRLRAEFDDPLFIKGPRGMIPTPRALALKEELSLLIAELEGFYSQTPSSSLELRTDTLKIAGTDYLESVLFSRSFNQVLEKAPNIQFLSKNLTGSLPQSELENGNLDIAVSGYFREIPKHFYQQTLFEDEFVCVISRNTAPKSRNLYLEAYLERPHILTSLTGDLDGIVDKKLRKMGKNRRLQMAHSNFTSPFFAIGDGPLTLTCLNKLAQKMAKPLGLKIVAPPIKLPKIKICQIWHERTHRDPLHSYVRKCLKESAASLG